MKRKLRNVLVSVLSLASVLSLTACQSEGSGGGGAEEPERTTFAEFEGIVDYVGTMTDKVDTSIKVDKKITWLSWWSIDETGAAPELFKAVYGVPEAGNEAYGDDKDHIFEYVYIAYADRYDKLASMVSTGDSPDIFQFEILNFPYSVYKGMFQPIDGVVDTNTEEWASTREVMNQFMWGGKNYCAITQSQIGIDQVMWYRRSVVTDAGLDDPYELYKAGNWTWDTFLDMCDKFQQSGEDKYACDGWQFPDRLAITCGVPFVSIENGQLKSNLYDPNIERSVNFVSNLGKENYRYPRHLLNNWSINVPAFASGDILFYSDGKWAWGDTLSNYATRYGWEENDCFFVPFPRDPNADKYYQSMKNDAYMWCAGSDNEAGFKAWTQCLLATSNDPNVTELGREQLKVNNNWTDEMLDFFDELEHGGALTPVFDFKQGIGQDIVNSSTIDNCMDSLIQYPYIQNEGMEISFTALRATNEGQINARIDELNATVQ